VLNKDILCIWLIIPLDIFAPTRPRRLRRNTENILVVFLELLTNCDLQQIRSCTYTVRWKPIRCYDSQGCAYAYTTGLETDSEVNTIYDCSRRQFSAVRDGIRRHQLRSVNAAWTWMRNSTEYIAHNKVLPPIAARRLSVQRLRLPFHSAVPYICCDLTLTSHF